MSRMMMSHIESCFCSSNKGTQKVLISYCSIDRCFFNHLGNTQHNKRSSKQLSNYSSSKHEAKLSLISVHLINLSPIVILLFALFWTPPTPDTNIWLF